MILVCGLCWLVLVFAVLCWFVVVFPEIKVLLFCTVCQIYVLCSVYATNNLEVLKIKISLYWSVVYTLMVCRVLLAFSALCWIVVVWTGLIRICSRLYCSWFYWSMVGREVFAMAKKSWSFVCILFQPGTKLADHMRWEVYFVAMTTDYDITHTLKHRKSAT